MGLIERLKGELSTLRDVMERVPFEQEAFIDALTKADGEVDIRLGRWRKSEVREYVEAIAMAVAIAVAGGQIARVPEPVVAAVVISALLHALDPRPLVRLWRLNKDQYVAAVAVVGVMILGVVDGMFVAVALSIAATLQRMSSPTIATLGKLGESRNFVDVTYMPKQEQTLRSSS